MCAGLVSLLVEKIPAHWPGTREEGYGKSIHRCGADVCQVNPVYPSKNPDNTDSASLLAWCLSDVPVPGSGMVW